MTFESNEISAALSYGAYARLVDWFPLASICDSKPVSHVCYCLNQNLVSFVQKMMVRLFTAAKLSYSQLNYQDCIPRLHGERYIPIFV